MGQRKEWCSEDQLPASWPIRERPDAVLLDDRGEIARAIEYGGDYSSQRLTELHNGFSDDAIGFVVFKLHGPHDPVSL